MCSPWAKMDGAGQLAVVAVDVVQPDLAGQVCVALFDAYECHDETPHRKDRPVPVLGR